MGTCILLTFLSENVYPKLNESEFALSFLDQVLDGSAIRVRSPFSVTNDAASDFLLPNLLSFAIHVALLLV